jgi:hypothetical protein
MSKHPTMKKTLLILVIALYAFQAKCQNVSTESTSVQFVFCELVTTIHSFKNVTVKIDFGNSNNFLSDSSYKDPSTGKQLVFGSMVDALNFMSKKGWEIVQVYTVGTIPICILKIKLKSTDIKT